MHARGIETPLIDAVAELASLAPGEAALDVGCGDGHYLGALTVRFGCEGHGVDISVAAIDAAARRYPALHWTVANADRVLPYADASFRVVSSITARRNAVEFRRVLRDDGTLLDLRIDTSALRDRDGEVIGWVNVCHPTVAGGSQISHG